MSAVFFLLNFEAGRGLLVTYLSDALKKEGFVLRYGKITGEFPFDFTVDELFIEQETRPVARLKDFHFKWRWAPLLRGVVAIDKFEASDADIYLDQEQKSADPSTPVVWPKYPLPVAIHFDGVKLGALHIFDNGPKYHSKSIEGFFRIDTFSKFSSKLQGQFVSPDALSFQLQAKGHFNRLVIDASLDVDDNDYVKGQLQFNLKKNPKDKDQLDIQGQILVDHIYHKVIPENFRKIKHPSLKYYVGYKPGSDVHLTISGRDDQYMRLSAQGRYQFKSQSIKAVLNLQGQALKNLESELPNHMLLSLDLDGSLEKIGGEAQLIVPAYSQEEELSINNLVLKAKFSALNEFKNLQTKASLSIDKLSSSYLREPVQFAAFTELEFDDDFNSIQFEDLKISINDLDGVSLLEHKATGNVKASEKYLMAVHELKLHDPSFFSDEIPGDSTLHVSGKTEGTMDAHHVKLTTSGNLGDADVKADIEAGYDPEKIEVSELEIETPAFNASAKGRYSFNTEKAQGHVFAKIIDLSRLNLPHALKGQGTLKIKGDGNKVQANFDFNNLQYEDYYVGQFEADIVTPSSKNLKDYITKTEAEIRVHNAFLPGEKELESLKIVSQGKDEGATVQLKATGIDQTLKFFTLRLIVPNSVTAQNGYITLETFKGSGSRILLQNKGPARFSWTLSKDPTYKLSPFSIHSLGGEMTISGQMTGDTFSAEANLDKFELADLSKIYNEFPLLGKVTGRIDAHGTMDNPYLKLNLTIDGLKNTIVPASLMVPYTAKLSLLLQDKKLNGNIDLTTPKFEPFNMTMKAEGISFSDPDIFSKLRVHAVMKGPIDIFYWSSIALMPDTWIFEGIASSDVTLNLINGQITGSGQIILNDIEAQYLAIGTYLKGDALALSFKENQAKLKGKLTDFNKGILEIDGNAQMATDYDVTAQAHLKLDKLSVVQMPLYKVMVSGPIDLQQRKSGTSITADLTSDNSYIIIPKSSAASLSDVIITRQSVKQAEIQEEKAVEDEEGKHSSIHLDATLTIPDGLFIQGFGLNSEWEGSIKANGFVDKLEFGGDVHVRRGALNLFGKSFKLNKGRVMLLSGQDGLDANIDIQSTAMIQNIEAIIAVHGNLNNMSIGLSSDPALPESEVLSYIVFGKSAATLSPFQAVQLANTLSEFTSSGSNSESLLSKVRNQLGLSNLTFDMNQAGDPTVGIGQYLQDGVYLQVKQGISQEETTAAVQVDLTDTLTAETEGTSDGDFGGGLNLRWRY